jgi:predicted nucleic acid-binding protein
LGVRTYVDSGVLIAAIRGNSAISEVARSYLFDPLRDYITSDYVAVELIPKAAYHGNHAESEFYQDFFNRATARVPSSDALMKAAIDEGSRTGISGLDAVHVACAVVGEAAELITSEKSTKPIHRTSAVTVVSINPQPPTTPQVSGTT